MSEDPCLVQDFEKIFRMHFSAVKSFIYMLLKSEADAEDIAQDVFIKLWTNHDMWKNSDRRDGYIYTLAKNLTFDFIRHKRIEENYLDEQIEEESIKELAGSADILNPIYYNEIQLILKMALERFPERRRIIFEMSRFKHMTNFEIAERLEISVRTVEHHIYLSLQNLRKILFILFFLYLL